MKDSQFFRGKSLKEGCDCCSEDEREYSECDEEAQVPL